MKNNLTNSFSALAVIVFVAVGCNTSKNGGATNSAANSWGDNTTTTNDYWRANRTNQPALPSSKAIAWNLANNVSMAAMLYDLKGAETSDSLAKAKILAQEVGVQVPPFPAKNGDKIKDTSAILGYLLSDVFKNFGDKISQKYGREEASLFEMSLKSNVLLLIYSPGAKEGKTIAQLIRNHAKDASLPENLWLPAVRKIESGASFDEVKDAILEMQDGVAQYLAKS